MAILIKLSSSLRNYIQGYDPIGGLRVEDAAGKSVAQLLDNIGIPSEKVKIIMVNSVHTSLDHVLKDGDRLGLFPPVGGG